MLGDRVSLIFGNTITTANYVVQLYSAKPNHRFRLKYVSAAVAHTDAPETIAEFISQRRRYEIELTD
jgi:cellulose synthase/poly-beta-1,6-N-acetylglucosamine synthase-like glycosyltransferase